MTHQSLNILLIGNGRLSRHFHHYLNLKAIPNQVWPEPRNLDPERLDPYLRLATHVFLLVSDQAIRSVFSTLKQQTHQIGLAPLFIHSSATTSILGTVTLHPLMTFGPELYTLDQYEQFPLTSFLEETSDYEMQLHPLFERLRNPRLQLNSKDRTRYHISCVMMSNFSQILWDASLKVSHQMGLGREHFEPILKQSLSNFIHLGATALTGPLKRNDQGTLEAHHQTLTGTNEGKLYQAFVDYYQNQKGDSLS